MTNPCGPVTDIASFVQRDPSTELVSSGVMGPLQADRIRTAQCRLLNHDFDKEARGVGQKTRILPCTGNFSQVVNKCKGVKGQSGVHFLLYYG